MCDVTQKGSNNRCKIAIYTNSYLPKYSDLLITKVSEFTPDSTLLMGLPLTINGASVKFAWMAPLKY